MENEPDWDTGAWARLGEAILQARGALPGRPTQKTAATQAGIGEKTWGLLEKGRLGDAGSGRLPHTGTLRAVEIYLGWPLGTCDRILRGEAIESQSADAAARIAAVERRADSLDERMARIESTLERLVDVLRSTGRRD